MESQIHFWAYALTCNKEIEDIRTEWNKAGPWQWELRERFFFGSYLNARPAEGVRVQLHEFFPDSESHAMYPGPGTVDGFRYKTGFTVQLEIHADSPLSKAGTDEVVRRLFQVIGAENVKAIDPYA